MAVAGLVAVIWALVMPAFRDLVIACFVLAIAGFVVYLVKDAPIAAPFKLAIQFLAIVAVAWYVLSLFGVV